MKIHVYNTVRRQTFVDIMRQTNYLHAEGLSTKKENTEDLPTKKEVTKHTFTGIAYARKNGIADPTTVNLIEDHHVR